MVSQDKLIKQGIKYNDALFEEIIKRLKQGIFDSDTLESFLEKTKDYTMGNPLINSGYDATMLRLILAETNNHKFTRPAQKQLARIVIENYVGNLITDIGTDIQETVRNVVKEGYNQSLSQYEIADNITQAVNTINNKRANALARTEIARTATVSDYIINKERGATHFYVECRNTACPICKEAWHKHWSKANDESFTPKNSSAGGKGWIGDRTYSMKDTAMLPPIHPNCRCVPYFISEDDVTGDVEPIIGRRPTTTTTETTSESVVKESDISEDVIADALRDALDSAGLKPTSKPKTKPKPKPEPKVKVVMEEPKPKIDVESILGDVLDEYGLDKKSKKKSKKKEKLKPKTEPKTETRTLKEHLRKELPSTFTDNTIDYLERKIKRRANAKQEYGEIFDYNTGKATSPEFKGGKSSVAIKEKDWIKPVRQMTREEQLDALSNPEKYKRSYVDGSNTLASIHNHPSDGSRAFSGADIFLTTTNEWEDYGIAISDKEVWVSEFKGTLPSIEAKDIEKKIDRLFSKSRRQTMKKIMAEYDHLPVSEKRAMESELLKDIFGDNLLEFINVKNKQWGIKLRRVRYVE